MTTGIYALYWEEQDLTYIGLSQDIIDRFADHKYDMREQKHSNYKVQNAFNNYGEPKLFILEKCHISELNELEIQWMKEFDALGEQGLCLVEGGQVGFGPNSGASKYSKLQILLVFRKLYSKQIIDFESISKQLGVKKSLIEHISRGYTHTWLSEIYNKKYKLMIYLRDIRCKAKKSIKTLGIYKNLPQVISPEGILYTVESIRGFVRAHNLNNGAFYQLMQGKIKSHKKWRMKNMDHLKNRSS